MDTPQSQREINKVEWGNPDNWSGVWPFRAYFSKRDSRLYIPTGSRTGTTLNSGHRFGPLALVLHTIAVVVLSAGIFWLLGRAR
jgi:uncharacterized membrane protein